MSLQDKYRAVLQLGETLNVTDGFIEEKDGKLHMGGTTTTQHEKNLLWDKIKEIAGNEPADLIADIKVAQTDYFHKHTVQSGESLSKIAKIYYDNAMEYMHIFNANMDILKDPDLIKVGQVLTIPFPKK